MIRSLLGLPVRVVKKVLGLGKPAAPPAAPSAAPRPAPRPRPPAPEAGPGGGHDHGHSHSHGGGHDHGHSHGEERAESPAPADNGHDHGHSHGEARAEAPAAPARGKKAAKAPAKSNVKVSFEDTPNPNARKFTCSVTVIEKGSLSFNEATEAQSHPLGRHVWAVGNVKSIFAVKDFVTVIKTDEADWNALTAPVIAAIQQGLAERDA